MDFMEISHVALSPRRWYNARRGVSIEPHFLQEAQRRFYGQQVYRGDGLPELWRLQPCWPGCMLAVRPGIAEAQRTEATETILEWTVLGVYIDGCLDSLLPAAALRLAQCTGWG